MPAAAGIAHDAASVQAPSAGTVSGIADQPAAEQFTPSPPAAAGAGSAQGGAAGSSGMGMMGGMGGQKGQGGEDTEHKSKIRLSGDLRDLLGTPERTTPTGDRREVAKPAQHSSMASARSSLLPRLLCSASLPGPPVVNRPRTIRWPPA